MPARTRPSRAAPVEVVEEQEEEPSQEEGEGGLDFNEALSWRAGKPIPVGDLLHRLKTLHAELKTLDQQDLEVHALKRISNDLASANLLGHKDKGVRACTACCVVDIFRLSAPDAPFTGTQLKVREKGDKVFKRLYLTT